MAVTPCECTNPGWCARHQCEKSAYWHYLCQNDVNRFAEWEQLRHEVIAKGDVADAVIEPPLWRKGMNYGMAVFRHVMHGARQVDPEVYEKRLQVCRACPQCAVDRMVCRHAQCGCDLTIKARWQTSLCPLLFWPQ